MTRPTALIVAIAAWLALTGASAPISWTVPANAATRWVEVIVRDANGVEWAAPVYADSARTRPHVPKAAGRDTAWIAEPAGAVIHWLRPCNYAGCADAWSNRLIGSAGLRDTLYTLTRGPGGRPLQSPVWQWARYGRVGFSLQVGDTAAARIVAQELVQRANSAKLTKVYGYWMLRGVPVLVEDHDPPRIDP